MTGTEAIALVGAAGTSAVGVIAAVATALAPLLPILLPLLLAHVQDSKARLALGAVTRAAIPAVSAASQTIYAAIEAAGRSDSPGGAAVTPDERRTAIAIGVARGLSVLTADPRTIRLVLDYYGSEDAVREALEVLIRRKALGHRLDEETGAALVPMAPQATTQPRTFGMTQT